MIVGWEVLFGVGFDAEMRYVDRFPDLSFLALPWYVWGDDKELEARNSRIDWSKLLMVEGSSVRWMVNNY